MKKQVLLKISVLDNFSAGFSATNDVILRKNSTLHELQVLIELFFGLCFSSAYSY